MTKVPAARPRPISGPLNRHFPVDEDLSDDRARSRLSAYVYGNILVLAAIIGTVGSEDHAHSWVIVLATFLTTYLAHIFAHNVGERIGRTEAEHETHLREGIRDAAPILSSGMVPMLIFVGVAREWFNPVPAEIVAAGLVVLRLASTGLAVERLSGRKASAATLWSGVGIAAAGIVIALIKVRFSH
ncbi:hypothetical protein [Kineosporia babensis]|uniref:Integral membrane protein n=1 Tax=Kineosporia babensis TaxID=499548 RepID=A0A9X1N8N7_9ACTN|nr:hypothetical protein [Kineosporia babensis]MCD5310562.1 hypothetical protein [Kineosporia babensis]